MVSANPDRGEMVIPYMDVFVAISELGVFDRRRVMCSYTDMMIFDDIPLTIIPAILEDSLSDFLPSGGLYTASYRGEINKKLDF
jgi:hypothetical protein